MKKILLTLLILTSCGFVSVNAQSTDSIEIYLLTCDPGTEVYSIYGHSAVRVSIPSTGFDRVYNWGIFDFATPNFAWKFSKGRLDYMIGESSYERFLEEYIFEGRSVYSQKINLTRVQKESVISQITENMLPENRLYRYDFFYDNCATRIRDIIEKSVGVNLLYPEDDVDDAPSFREKLSEAQEPMPWLNSGINLLIGLPGDKITSFREQMFLPLDLKMNLSSASIRNGSEILPLLREPATVLEFEPKTVSHLFFLTPAFIFWMLLIITILFSFLTNKRNILRVTDIILFSIFSVLSALMIFFTFFTDHQAMKMNLNVLWINPVLILCLLSLFFKRFGLTGFRIIFFTSLLFFCSVPFIPQHIDRTFIPLILLLCVRSLDNSDFKWNPLRGK
jgi:hypothetical protein